MSVRNLVLLTSIPPALRGIPFSYSDQQSLQTDAIKSWQALGSTIVSLNTSKEIDVNPEFSASLLRAGIHVVTAPPSSFKNYAYLPCIRDSLHEVLSLYPDHLFVLTNADIVFNRPQFLVKALEFLGPRRSALAHRNDICSFPHSSTPYLGGFDFFAFHSRTLASVVKILPSCLSLALPWWDLYFALALTLSSSSIILLDYIYFSHFIHDDRWVSETWRTMGDLARRQFIENLSVNYCLSDRDLERSDIKRILHLASGHPRSIFTRSRIKRRLRSLARTRGWQPIHLHELSDAILSCVQESCITI